MWLKPNFRAKVTKFDKLSMCVEVLLSTILLLFVLSVLVGLAGCATKGDKPQAQVVEPNEKKAKSKKGTKRKGANSKGRKRKAERSYSHEEDEKPFVITPEKPREGKRKVETEEEDPILPPFDETKAYRCKPKAGEAWPPGCFRYERKHGEDKTPLSGNEG